MGAYAPTPLVTPNLLKEITRTVLQPAIDGLRREGRPYVGVIFAGFSLALIKFLKLQGLMLTDAGPQTLEFNCRLGDPETQVFLLVDALSCRLWFPFWKLIYWI
jgi:phosphoribosylamine-glycine ligase